MKNNILDFLRNREPSPFAAAAAANSRQVPEVDTPYEDIPETPSEDMKNGDEIRQGSGRIVDEDDDEEDAILSAEEIDVMAESKAIKWGIGTSLIANGINAALLLTPREWRVYYDWKDRELDEPDRIPLPTPTVARVLRKVQRLEQAKEDNALTDKEQKMLMKAIKAELKVKNKLGRLNRSGVMGTVADILLAKAAPGVTEGVLRGVNAIMNKITGQR